MPDLEGRYRSSRRELGDQVGLALACMIMMYPIPIPSLIHACISPPSSSRLQRGQDIFEESTPIQPSVHLFNQPRKHKRSRAPTWPGPTTHFLWWKGQKNKNIFFFQKKKNSRHICCWALAWSRRFDPSIRPAAGSRSLAHAAGRLANLPSRTPHSVVHSALRTAAAAHTIRKRASCLGQPRRLLAFRVRWWWWRSCLQAGRQPPSDVRWMDPWAVAAALPACHRARSTVCNCSQSDRWAGRSSHA